LHFLNPAVLIGLVAAVIPLAIHLLNRGRTRPLPFSNLHFLRRLHHSRMRRVRLRQWLVLLLRTLIIALIISAFAHPTYQAGSGWGGRSVPTAAVLLLDLSYSTGYRLAGGPLFAQLQRQGLELLGLFESRDQVTLIPFDSHSHSSEEAGGDLERLQERLRELAPGEAATELKDALQTAAEYLADRPEMDRELFLLTDLARHNWGELNEVRSLLPEVRVYISELEVPERGNIHIDGVRSPGWMPAVGQKLPLQILLTNSSKQGITGGSLDLFLDGERVRHRDVDLRPGEQAGVELTVTPRRSGRLSGHVELEEDALPLDNRRYFTIDVPERIEVLILGERPADTYYPRRALGAAGSTDPVLVVRSGLFAELNGEGLGGTDVLIVCNLQRLNGEQTRVIHDFVANGGGLILIPGPLADLNFYNRDLLSGLLPVAIKGSVGDGGEQGDFQHLDPDRPYHPLFEGLLGAQPEDRPRFFKRFDLVPRDGLQPLIHFADGRIALAAAWNKQGRTVFIAAPLSLEWSDLPLKGLFAPMLQRLVRDLSLSADRHTAYLVGETAYRHLEGLSIDSAVQAESPSGRRWLLEPELLGGQYRWKVPRLDESGIWRLWLGDREVGRFPVNVDTREGDLTPVGRERLLQLFGAERTHFMQSGEDLRLQVLGNRYGRELWREFLGLALVLLLLELWIARAPRDVPESVAVSGRGMGDR